MLRFPALPARLRSTSARRVLLLSALLVTVCTLLAVNTASPAPPPSQRSGNTGDIAESVAVESSTSVPAAPAGWTTRFEDDFSGAAGSDVDAQWMHDTGPGSGFGTGEIETMTNSTDNVHLDGTGRLDLTAVDNGGSWTSGRVETTSPVVGAPAGGRLYLAAAIMQPDAGPGYWPAFWLLGPGQWPENGEIDVLEDVNSLSQHSSTIHCGTDPGGPCDEKVGRTSGLMSCAGCQTGYHVYAMLLDRTDASDESITFYLDGTQYYSVNEGQVGQSAWQAAYDHDMSIILDLAVGGGYPDAQCGCTTPTDATVSGGTMSVRYVVAFTADGTGGDSRSAGGSAGGSDSPTAVGSPDAGTGTSPAGAGGSRTGQITGNQGLCLDDQYSSTELFNPVQAYTCNGTRAQNWTVVEAGSTIQAFGECLDIAGGGTANGTAVDLYTCNATAAQVWIPRTDGSLYNPQADKCLDDTDWGGTGTRLQIWDCTGNANQKWTLPSGAN